MAFAVKYVMYLKLLDFILFTLYWYTVDEVHHFVYIVHVYSR